jgi:hypothetical protein
MMQLLVTKGQVIPRLARVSLFGLRKRESFTTRLGTEYAAIRCVRRSRFPEHATSPFKSSPCAEKKERGEGHGDPQIFDALLVSRDQVCGSERIIVPLGIFDR